MTPDSGDTDDAEIDTHEGIGLARECDTPSAGPVLARLDRPRSDPPVTLAVIADPHVAVDARDTWKVYHRTRARLRTAIRVANERADAALLAGDLTRDGHPGEFEAADAALSALSIPWTAVPGNHDVPKAFDDHDPPARGFTERYGETPVAVDCGQLTLCAVNSASGESLGDTWGGRVGRSQQGWLADRLETCERPVVLSHHPVGALPDCPPDPRLGNFQLDDADAVRSTLRGADVPLVVSAHHHVPAILSHGDVTEVVSPATCSFPQASLHVEVDPRGTTLRLVPLADRAGVAEAHSLARDGTPLGRTVLELVERRLGSGPEV